MAKPPGIVLTPFFRPGDEDAEDQEMYVAGFVDEDGVAWGTIQLEAEMVEQAVMGHRTFEVWCDSDGCMQPQPAIEEPFEFGEGQLKKTPLDELVANTIELDKNEPNDEILDMFETLHERLLRATSAVADEIARRRR
ncbi:hypothetical protein EI171_00775 (plasmid) [Bradyrhizobium sp. LCT2]|uniref:hypothetical protein n=1 Tax=Bradyrhizobium sp. LCT2 TaxID=2493093 RepID=UPI00137410B6|nr:hypothetical protein [Bradyrhizobium sp. LCT2]QHP66104.1 hypothetical protein EI171_00775 [Bradyrhizobium sp. LCT2]